LGGGGRGDDLDGRQDLAIARRSLGVSTVNPGNDAYRDCPDQQYACAHLPHSHYIPAALAAAGLMRTILVRRQRRALAAKGRVSEMHSSRKRPGEIPEPHFESISGAIRGERPLLP